VYDRFTDAARHVAAEAAKFAREMGSQCVGTEHLLIALVSQPDDRAFVRDILSRKSKTSQMIVDAVDRIVCREDPIGIGVRIPLSVTGRRVILKANEIALAESSFATEPEHIFIALFDVPEGVAAEVLKAFGFVRDEVLTAVRIAFAAHETRTYPALARAQRARRAENRLGGEDLPPMIPTG